MTMGRQAKFATNSRYLSESRFAGASEQDHRNSNDNETIRLQIYNIERKMQLADVKRQT